MTMLKSKYLLNFLNAVDLYGKMHDYDKTVNATFPSRYLFHSISCNELFSGLVDFF